MDKLFPQTYYFPIMASERVQRRIERLLDQAEEAMDRLDWESVRDIVKVVLGLDPENSDALVFLASVDRVLEDETAAPPAQATTRMLTPPPDQPASFANGRYLVKQFLGEGGKKRVYLAHDTTLDREVAFALIKSEGLDDTSRTRITREAQAMGRLGSHPHIVTVFDLGQEGDLPYMVTELMGGGDVESLIEKATDHRLSLEQAIGIAQETCQGLEFAHSRGIVHRDRKPGNVWLTEDGIAKIGDIGVAVDLERAGPRAEAEQRLLASPLPRRVDQHAEQHHRLRDAVDHGVEERPEGGRLPGLARERPVEHVERAGEQHHDAPGEQLAGADQHRRDDVAGQPGDGDRGGRDVQRRQPADEREDQALRGSGGEQSRPAHAGAPAPLSARARDRWWLRPLSSSRS